MQLLSFPPKPDVTSRVCNARVSFHNKQWRSKLRQGEFAWLGGITPHINRTYRYIAPNIKRQWISFVKTTGKDSTPLPVNCFHCERHFAPRIVHTRVAYNGRGVYLMLAVHVPMESPDTSIGSSGEYRDM